MPDDNRNFRRVLFLSDLHCGHRVGLTHPSYQYFPNHKWYEIQVQLWDAYIDMLSRIKPIDICVINGDAIDGKGYRSGGTEQITADRNTQCEMAMYAITETGADNYLMTYGTGYHVGTEEDFEGNIAHTLGCKIGSHEWLDVNGCIFDIKHKIGSTSVPYGRGTQIAKDRLWNYLWSEHEEQPKADVIIRSHVHSFYACMEDSWMGVITPALQGQGSKFGARQCSGHVDFGMVWFDVYPGGTYSWGRDIAYVEAQRVDVIRL